jgi:hypothetical protein
VNYLNDLSIPTEAATYLSFPTANAGRAFDVFIDFGDGAYVNRSGPYQHVSALLQYDITSLQVTAVPEPAGAVLFALAGIPLLSRQARRQSPLTRRRALPHPRVHGTVATDDRRIVVATGRPCRRPLARRGVFTAYVDV